MARVAIITRAMNRLEYTVLCVRNVQKMAGMKDYEHIIVNQNSSDGTKEWLHSIVCEEFYKIKVVNNEVNTGDAGGMKDGFDVLSDDCEYVMQFDNDCYPLTENFLKDLVDIMDSDPNIGCIMCKREGVGTIVKTSKEVEINNHILGNIKTGTCCIMFRRTDLKRINCWYSKEKIGWAQVICANLHHMKKKVLKCLDIKVMHVDKSGGQKRRYPLYHTHKRCKTNYSVINYRKVRKKK